MASDRGYSALPDGYVFVPGDSSEIIGALPVDSLDRVQVAAGYGVYVPSDVKLPKGLSAAKGLDEQTVDGFASIQPEPVIEIPVGETPEPVDGGPVSPEPEAAPATPDAPASA